MSEIHDSDKRWRYKTENDVSIVKRSVSNRLVWDKALHTKFKKALATLGDKGNFLIFSVITF